MKDTRKILSLVALLVLAIGLPFALSSIKHPTGTQQKALVTENLNSSSDGIVANNSDGTMGPADYTGNFSNSLSSDQQGYFTFYIIDPPPPDKGKPNAVETTKAQGNEDNGKNDTNPHATITSPNSDNNGGGPQTVSSLLVTIGKIEAHLAYLGTPGNDDNNTSTPTGAISTVSSTPKPSISVTSKVSVSPSPQNGRPVDHWETLNIGGAKTIDLVALARSRDLAFLGLTKLAIGRYTEVRLYITKATATLDNGSQVVLTILGKDNIVKIVRSFTIVSGKTTNLTLDFDAQHSVIKAGDTYLLKPVVAKFVESK